MKLKLTQQFWFYVFIVLNCFLGVTSFILFVLSIKAQDHLFQYKLIIQYTIPAIYPTGIFTGCLGLVTTCLGFLGIWRKINIFYILHVICLTIETIINLCIAVVSVIIDDQFFINAKEALNTTLKYYYEKNEYGDEFDKLHMTFFCCGVNSYADFRKAKLLIPYSCRVGQFVYARFLVNFKKCCNGYYMHEHQLAVKLHDMSSLISMHMDNYGHTFDWKNMDILDRGNSKNTKEFLEAWHSGQSVINKHIEINPIYQPIRKIMQKYRNKNQTNARYNQNKEINNDRFKVNKNQSTSRSKG